jgi:hypothetical protein
VVKKTTWNRVWWNCCIEMDAAAKQFLEERRAMLKECVSALISVAFSCTVHAAELLLKHESPFYGSY